MPLICEIYHQQNISALQYLPKKIHKHPYTHGHVKMVKGWVGGRVLYYTVGATEVKAMPTASYRRSKMQH